MQISGRKPQTLEHFLPLFFEKNQGVRLGETTVLSRQVHGNNPATPGEIRIYSDQDAGQYYQKAAEPQLILHMDVFHEPACLDPVYVARHIQQALETYFNKLREENRSAYSPDRVREICNMLTRRIVLRTSGGEGVVRCLARREAELVPEKARRPSPHVHLLFSIEPGFYDSILFLADGVEKAIGAQGFEIRRVEKIIHCEKHRETEPEADIGLALPGFKSPETQACRTKQNRLQVIMNLAGSFGSIEDAARFLESLTTTGNLFLGSFAGKHHDGNLQQTFLDLINLKLVRKGRFTFTLTTDGKYLKDFIRAHQQELEALVRKSIRRHQVTRHNYQTYTHSRLKSKKSRLTDHKKIANRHKHAWLSDIALPETVMQAAVRSFLEGAPRMNINSDDIKVYGLRSFAPIDTCIAIDCSGSMVGEKIRAVSYLAEHFLLTSREKVSIVSFQEMEARTVVPFTKNYQKLQDGLRTISPEGLTPLARGIVESVELIKSKKARNPLLVLITDGIPNFPLWTQDAQRDALTAAAEIPRNKIRLVCIGVIPNEDFMRELADTGQGNLYIVDELNKNSLVDVVTREWEHYKYTR